MIQIHFSPIVIPSLIAAALVFTSAIILWNRRSAVGALSLVFLLLAVSIWSFCYSFEVLIVGIANKMIWIKLEYIGIVSVAIF